MPSKEARQRNLIASLKALKEAGLTSYVTKNNGFALIFRDKRMVAVDYYPSTNKWCSEGKTHYGDANKFVKWYIARRDKHDLARAGRSIDPMDLMGQALEELYATVRATHDAVETVAQLILENQSDD